MALMLSSTSFPLLLLALLSPATATVGKASEDYDQKSPVVDQQTNFLVARSTCSETLYRDVCVDTLTSFLEDLRRKTIPEIVARTIKHVRERVEKSSSRASWLSRKTSSPCELMALEDCRQLFHRTLQELDATLEDLHNTNVVSSKAADVNTLLSAATTNQYTCLDGFSHCDGWVRSRIEKGFYNISRLVSNSFAIAKKIDPTKERRAVESGEAFPKYGGMKHGFHRWVSADDRRLLQANVSRAVADLVVAKDGNGHFTTISEGGVGGAEQEHD
ncbi:pectinesterase 2-like [Nymphaea colorata]|uniref:pectinesterase 2-like n=1 Tax=Nymphaea colorata TaxID=210225 RepID=UPI00129DFDB6|nr:pectinesterase 2-like [Nymphaea colorata]XP_031496618.1 pectinesterase 2-like [Nymphaea colorata]XP_031496619.1 pectinesterase 2-like [Nymphaea colorata]